MNVRALLGGLWMLCAAAGALLAGRVLADDVGQALGHLSSPNAAERSSAQRWLSAHLRPEDLAAVSSAAQAGDAEVRARLVEALSSEDRLLGLSAALSVARAADAAALGRAALVESAERWSPGSKKPGLVQTATFDALRTQHDRTIAVDARLSVAPLDDLFDLLARAMPGGISIAVDPRCVAAGAEARAIDGRLDSVLSDLLAARGLACRGFGLGEDEPDGAEAWIAVVPRDSEARANSASNLLTAWCVAVAGTGDAAVREKSARALAASGWPAASGWLAERWLADDDPAALEGVLLAARRGRVSPLLLSKDARVRLRAAIKNALDSSQDVRAIGIATALGATGTLGAKGEDLLAPALEGLTEMKGRELHVRLVELEQSRPAGPEAERALAALLARPDLVPASQWLVLSMLSRCQSAASWTTSGPATISEPERLVVWCRAQGRLDELVRLLRGTPAFPPPGWRKPSDLPATFDLRTRAFLVSAWLARGEVDAAADHVAALIVSPTAREELAFGLLAAEKDLGVEPVVEVFARVIATSAADPAPALRAAALAGAARSDDLVARVMALLPESVILREDALLLGALAAGPRGADARTRLIAALRGALEPDDALAAADRAVSELRAARDETVERAFVRDARAAARAGRPQVRSRLRIDAWPVPPPGDPLRLADFDRSLERAGLR